MIPNFAITCNISIENWWNIYDFHRSIMKNMLWQIIIPKKFWKNETKRFGLDLEQKSPPNLTIGRKKGYGIRKKRPGNRSSFLEAEAMDDPYGLDAKWTPNGDAPAPFSARPATTDRPHVQARSASAMKRWRKRQLLHRTSLPTPFSLLSLLLFVLPSFCFFIASLH